jgi:UDP-N-acetylglucosamine 2-epimerase (hydrolysing)
VKLDAQKRKIVFLTGTRADFGKIKSLLIKLDDTDDFDIFVFVTGMHMLSRYGSTWEEVRALGVGRIYTFINQNDGDSMESAFAKTVSGFSDYVHEIKPDLVVVHGDRLETLAGATVGALAGVLVAHIEGGEVSGTVDELIRHAVTKLSHIHFVANESAASRVIQLGEKPNLVHVIGSPDIDVMNSDQLPSLDSVREHYGITFEQFAIVILHPVTTELADLNSDVKNLIAFLIRSELNYVVIYPNNDPGSSIIIDAYAELGISPHFKIFPSMRFEYFLSLLRNAEFIIGNSSSGVREAPHFGVPAINLGSRQFRRATSDLVINTDFQMKNIVSAAKIASKTSRVSESNFGDGHSAQKFVNVVNAPSFWQTPIQKSFIDLQ